MFLLRDAVHLMSMFFFLETRSIERQVCRIRRADESPSELTAFRSRGSFSSVLQVSIACMIL